MKYLFKNIILLLFLVLLFSFYPWRRKFDSYSGLFYNAMEREIPEYSIIFLLFIILTISSLYNAMEREIRLKLFKTFYLLFILFSLYSYFHYVPGAGNSTQTIIGNPNPNIKMSKYYLFKKLILS